MTHEDLTPVQVLLDRAGLLYKRGERQEYVKVLEDVLYIDPSNSFALGGLGICILSGEGVVRDPARAVELLKQARKFGNVRATIALATVYRGQGDLLKAELFVQGGAGS